MSARLTFGVKSDSEKVNKINLWITRKIRYDVKGYITHRDKPWSVKKTIRKRKGMCGEYSQLFKQLCESAGISCLVVNGYSKNFMTDNGDAFFVEDHSWNIFKIGSKWHLSDLTWASGQLVIRYSPLFVLQYKLKLRKFPYELMYKKKFDPYYLFSNGIEFGLDHFPNTKQYQLLKDERELMDFENLYGIKDSIDNYVKRSVGNEKTECEICENNLNRDPIDLKYVSSKEHLIDNPRNTFSYLHYFIPYDIKTCLNVEGDTNRIKEEIDRYETYLPYINCTKENIDLNYRMNKNQITNKKRIFRYEYLNKYKAALRQNQKAIGTNRYFSKKLNRYIFTQKIKYFFKFRSLLLYRILLPVAPATQTKRESKRLTRLKTKKTVARNNSISSLNECNSLISEINERDSLLNTKLKQSLQYYKYNNKAHSILNENRGAFLDVYDYGIMGAQDSIICRSGLITGFLNNSVTDTKIIYKQMRAYIKLQKEFLFYMSKYKKYIIQSASNDIVLNPYKMELRAADSVINRYYSSFVDQMNLRSELAGIHLDDNSSLKVYKKDCKKLLYQENFYHQCRELFEKNYFKRDRFVKRKHYKMDSKYIKLRIRILKKQLKTEKRKALKRQTLNKN